IRETTVTASFFDIGVRVVSNLAERAATFRPPLAQRAVELRVEISCTASGRVWVVADVILWDAPTLRFIEVLASWSLRLRGNYRLRGNDRLHSDHTLS